MGLVSSSLALGSTVLILCIFGQALMGKLKSWPEFLRTVAEYRIVPPFLAAGTAYALVLADICILITATLRLAPVWSTVAALLMLMLFAIAMGVNLLRGRRDIDCGCHLGGKGQSISWGLVLRNCMIGLLVLPAATQISAKVSNLQIVDGVGAGLTALALITFFGEYLTLREAAHAFQRRFS